MLHLSTLLLACKFGYCVVEHQPNTRIFLRLDSQGGIELSQIILRPLSKKITQRPSIWHTT